jgi:ABC-2 type transport system permease protein
MSAITLIARDELRLMRRNRVAVVAFALLVLLTLAAALISWSHQQSITETRARFQAQAAKEFEAQPDRHPHRMVHFGNFIFRPLGPLAAFDPGIDAFTGNSMFLEGHRQNSANFGDVRQSSLLVRFGQLTPAFVLQVIAPLLLIFLGYGAVARKRERGTLRQMLVQGVSARALVMGKLLALGMVAALVGLPAMIAFLLIAGQPGALAGPMLVIALGYAAYLTLWAIIVILVSALVRRGRDALLALLALWAVLVILLPRVAPDFAAQVHALPTRLETDIAIAQDLHRLGDSHNPDDPFFNAFKEKTLRQYGVTRVEDLPVNYNGLLGMEGEKLTSGLFDDYADRSFAIQAAQSHMTDGFGIVSPAISLRQLSMAAAGTDLAGHRRFLTQAEAYRYDMVQRLNRLQAEAVSYADDKAKDADADQRKRVSADHWHAIPQFHFRPASAVDLVQASLPGLGLLLVWLVAAALALLPVARHLQKARP